MLYRQLCLAATAAAFLVVPEVTEADKDVISTLPAPVDAAHPVLMPSDLHLDIPYHQEGGADAAIGLNFLVEGGSRLTLNGFELYPSADPWHGDLTAEVEANGAREEKTLGYGLFVKPEVSDAEQQLSLVAIDLQLLEVGGVFDKGLPKVEIKLIKGPTGDIVIGSVDAVVESVEEKANNPLLRIKEKVEEFWKKLSSGCSRHRKQGGGKHGHFETYEGGRPFRHDNPHGHHRHGGHRHRHDWGRLLKNIAANIVLPVLAGITAGVGVAVLTMGLCSCFALIFRARRRRSRRAARQSEVASTEPAFAEEKAGLMEAQEEYEDAPPQYQDAEQTTEQTK